MLFLRRWNAISQSLLVVFLLLPTSATAEQAPVAGGDPLASQVQSPLQQLKAKHEETKRATDELMARYDQANQNFDKINEIIKRLDSGGAAGSGELSNAQVEAFIANDLPVLENFYANLVELQNQRVQYAAALGELRFSDTYVSGEVAMMFPATAEGRAAYDLHFGTELDKLQAEDATKKQELLEEMKKLDPDLAFLIANANSRERSHLVETYDPTAMMKLRIEELRKKVKAYANRKNPVLFFPKADGSSPVPDTAFPARMLTTADSGFNRIIAKKMIQIYSDCNIHQRENASAGDPYNYSSITLSTMTRLDAFRQRTLDLQIFADKQFEKDANGEKHLRSLLGNNPALPKILSKRDADVYRLALVVAKALLLNGNMALVKWDSANATVEKVDCEFSPSKFQNTPANDSASKVYNRAKYFYISIADFSQLIEAMAADIAADPNGPLKTKANGTPKDRELALLEAKRRIETDIFPADLARANAWEDETQRYILSDVEVKTALIEAIKRSRTVVSETMLRYQRVLDKAKDIPEQVWQESGGLARAVYKFRGLDTASQVQILLAPIFPAAAIGLDPQVDPSAPDPRQQAQMLAREIRTRIESMGEYLEKITLYDKTGTRPLTEEEFLELPMTTGGAAALPSIHRLESASAAEKLSASQFKMSIADLNGEGNGIAAQAFIQLGAIKNNLVLYDATVKKLGERLNEGVAAVKMVGFMAVAVAVVATAGTATPLLALYIAGSQAVFSAALAGANIATGMPAEMAYRQFGLDLVGIAVGGTVGVGAGALAVNTVLAFRAMAGLSYTYAAMGLGARLATNVVAGAAGGGAGNGAAFLATFVLVNKRLPENEDEWKTFGKEIAKGCAIGGVFGGVFTLAHRSASSVPPQEELAIRPPKTVDEVPIYPSQEGTTNTGGTGLQGNRSGQLVNPEGGTRLAYTTDGRTVAVAVEPSGSSTAYSPGTTASAVRPRMLTMKEANALGIKNASRVTDDLSNVSTAELTPLELNQLSAFQQQSAASSGGLNQAAGQPGFGAQLPSALQGASILAQTTAGIQNTLSATDPNAGLNAQPSSGLAQTIQNLLNNNQTTSPGLPPEAQAILDPNAGLKPPEQTWTDFLNGLQDTLGLGGASGIWVVPPGLDGPNIVYMVEPGNPYPGPPKERCGAMNHGGNHSFLAEAKDKLEAYIRAGNQVADIPGGKIEVPLVFWDEQRNEWREGNVAGIRILMKQVGALDYDGSYMLFREPDGKFYKRLPLARCGEGLIFKGTKAGFDAALKQMPAETWAKWMELRYGDKISIWHTGRNQNETLIFEGFEINDRGRLSLVYVKDGKGLISSNYDLTKMTPIRAQPAELVQPQPAVGPQLPFKGSQEAFDVAQRQITAEMWAIWKNLQYNDEISIWHKERKQYETLRFEGFELTEDGLLRMLYVKGGEALASGNYDLNKMNPIKPQPAARAAVFPQEHPEHFGTWPNHVKDLQAKWGKTAAAVPLLLARADKLSADLDSIAAKLKKAIDANPGALNSSATTLDPALEAALNALFDAKLLEGTGYVSSPNLALTMGEMDATGWVDSPQKLAHAANGFARKAEMAAGEVIRPALVQFIDKKIYEVLSFSEDNKNWRALFFECVLVNLEENYHVVQSLRLYAETLRGNPAGNKSCNISKWAQGAGFMVEQEADVFAKLQELFGPLGRHWRQRYTTRAYVP